VPSRKPKPLPTPVAAALGIVPTILDSARRLPGKAAQIPVLAVSTALTALETARKEYDELAGRGERLVGRLRGGSFDVLEDRVEDLVQGTPLATPYDVVEDVVDDTVAKVTELLDRAASPKSSVKKVQRVETAATPDVVTTVEAVAAAVDTPEVTAHDDLPLPDYDHMTLGSLRGRLRSLSVEELVRVRDYEKAHAHRLPVVTLLDNRIAKLAADAAAAPKKSAPRTKAATT
jgi:hypothetical protein